MEFDDLMIKRRSIRRYDTDRRVTRQQIEEIINACMLAPSWKNSQTGRYYAVTSDELLDEFRQTILPGFNSRRTAGAALVVATYIKGISGFNEGQPANELGDQWGAYDLGLQNAYFCLKAADMGLATLIMGLRYADKIRNYLDIPDNEEIVSVLAIGYGAEEASVRDRLKSSEVLKLF